MYRLYHLPGVIGDVSRGVSKVSLTGCTVGKTSIELGLEVVAVCVVFNMSIAGEVEVVVKDEDSEVCGEVVMWFCKAVTTAHCVSVVTVLCDEAVRGLCCEVVPWPCDSAA